jgi:hypothetical protein
MELRCIGGRAKLRSGCSRPSELAALSIGRRQQLDDVSSARDARQQRRSQILNTRS